jgi:hypothetical protein
VRFVFAIITIAPSIREDIETILRMDKQSTPSLNMKSRFKLQDALKL